ncbi:MAG: RNA-binding transcriptional accessory protein [Erysipelotrichaceae bacterium]|nr:RNA-binding transcriptional accessory protein [Erysipelotrichaceae bacterium]
MSNSIEILSRQLSIPSKNIQAVLDLLEQGATIPFIARYRKEMTGSLDEEVLRTIETQYKYQENLRQRKDDIIRLIEEKGLMNEKLKKEILACEKLADAEELYRPFKEKKHTKATAAIEAGLEPLASALFVQPDKTDLESILAPWREKTGMDNAKLLEQAGYIIAQNLSDDPALRREARQMLNKSGQITSSKKKNAEDEKELYAAYYDFSSPLTKIKPHQVLALNRGEKAGVLSVSLEIDQDWLLSVLEKRVLKNRRSVTAPIVKDCLKDAWKRLIFPSLGREIRRELTETAQESSIETFKTNLEHLLMTRPLAKSRILGFDPAFRTGCKLAVLDEQGSLLDIEVIYPHPPVNKKEQAARMVKDLIRKYAIQYVAIGNGTASRESEAFMADVLKDVKGVKYAIVSEAGASVYSASDLAREEFPDLTVEKRSAVSIGRRIQDPLSELVKIDPKSIGVGEYQHDVNQKQLSEALDFTTQKVVNRVGVNINTASPAILKHISGLNKTSIKKLLDYRKAHPIASREEISAIKGISDKTYEQCIGFLRVPDSANFLDNTGIHPESYELTYKILDFLNLDLKDMKEESFKKTLRTTNPTRLARQFGSDTFTVVDIVKELLNPGLDPRSSVDGPVLKSNILEIADLAVGMELSGTVRNVTSFGAFVDIGLHNDGLVHISKMSSSYVSNPNDVVHTGQIVSVYVDNIDASRERVGLSLIPPKKDKH